MPVLLVYSAASDAQQLGSRDWLVVQVALFAAQAEIAVAIAFQTAPITF